MPLTNIRLTPGRAGAEQLRLLKWVELRHALRAPRQDLVPRRHSRLRRPHGTTTQTLLGVVQTEVP